MTGDKLQNWLYIDSEISVFDVVNLYIANMEMQGGSIL